ncbi:hypothetical protein AQUCO_00200236v1 [Aquilegia coerulea]|uniref:SKP1 component POZ domain-containing protein n=1 Tax=Aquilegia coerulea TaxID=218851 RepID=A0A2G5F2A7_AQUCA|nr:hypothetical protein AQUCO_00200236v1 [Aquilegia coerulea]
MTKKSVGVDGSSSSSRKDKGKAVMVEETQKAVNNNVNVEEIKEGENVKKVTVRCSDGEIFEIEETVLSVSQTLKHMIEVDCVEDGVYLHNITGDVMTKVIEYCRKHAGKVDIVLDEDEKEELKKWDNEFLDGFDGKSVLHLIKAIDFLSMDALFHQACQRVADSLTAEQIAELRRYLADQEGEYTAFND